MENARQANGSKLAVLLVLAIAAFFLIRGAQEGSGGIDRLIIGAGLALTAPYAWFKPGWSRLATRPRRKAPAWTVIALMVGLVVIVATFVIAMP